MDSREAFNHWYYHVPTPEIDDLTENDAWHIWQAAQKDALNKAADEWNDTWGASKLRKMAGEI